MTIDLTAQHTTWPEEYDISWLAEIVGTKVEATITSSWKDEN